jgi:protein-S-isoprenylcysteine O-methyltransferase Ste14
MPSNLPALAVGLIVAVYWMRVLHLARKIRRRAGHTANVIPPRFVDRLMRAVWLPVVLLWIAIPLAGPFVSNPSWLIRPLFAAPPLAWIALLIAAAAFILTLLCWKKMGKSWRMGIDPAEKTSLIVTGPFSRVRHPIYGLSSVLMLATMAIEPAPLMIAVGILHLTLLQLEAAREERYLESIHGAAYARYRASTGRFFPKLRPRVTEREGSS